MLKLLPHTMGNTALEHQTARFYCAQTSIWQRQSKGFQRHLSCVIGFNIEAH